MIDLDLFRHHIRCRCPRCVTYKAEGRVFIPPNKTLPPAIPAYKVRVKRYRHMAKSATKSNVKKFVTVGKPAPKSATKTVAKTVAKPKAEKPAKEKKSRATVFVGKTSGLRVAEYQNKTIAANRKNKLTDTQLAADWHKEFPNAVLYTEGHVKGVRSAWNKGHRPGQEEAPAVEVPEYDKSGNVVTRTRGPRKGAGKKAAKAAKKTKPAVEDEDDDETPDEDEGDSDEAATDEDEDEGADDEDESEDDE